MEKSKVFRLSHLVLYAKGWYKITDNVWDDLKEMLKLDDYTPFSKGDVYLIIANAFQEFDYRASELYQVMLAIHPSECWKYGYFVKENSFWSTDKTVAELPDYDMSTAFIHYVLSTLRFIENDKWKLVTPKYKKYPKNPEISLQKVIEHFTKHNGKSITH